MELLDALYTFTLKMAFLISGAMEMQGAWPSWGKKIANMPGWQSMKLSAMRSGYFVMSFSAL